MAQIPHVLILHDIWTSKLSTGLSYERGLFITQFKDTAANGEGDYFGDARILITPKRLPTNCTFCTCTMLVQNSLRIRAVLPEDYTVR